MAANKFLPELKRRADPETEWEQVVFAEVLVPDTPNTWGDVYTPAAIKEFCYEFARQGYGIDVNHDNNDITTIGAYVVETFIARLGDPDFIEGSWVVGMKIVDDKVWADILSGEINGYSYEALVMFLPIIFEITSPRTVEGVTAADPVDGHTHVFAIVLDSANTVVAGGTGETDGHSHNISTHTITDEADGHVHRFQIHEPPAPSATGMSLL